eukprot:7380441-Prymnesium_polylepis.2
MHANADVRDEWQLLGDRRRQHVGQRPADLVQRRQHARRIGRRLSADSGHLVDAPELRQEGGALRGRRRRVRTDPRASPPRTPWASAPPPRHVPPAPRRPRRCSSWSETASARRRHGTTTPPSAGRPRGRRPTCRAAEQIALATTRTL